VYSDWDRRVRIEDLSQVAARSACEVQDFGFSPCLDNREDEPFEVILPVPDGLGSRMALPVSVPIEMPWSRRMIACVHPVNDLEIACITMRFQISEPLHSVRGEPERGSKSLNTHRADMPGLPASIDLVNQRSKLKVLVRVRATLLHESLNLSQVI
jgi:hypothetical protein